MFKKHQMNNNIRKQIWRSSSVSHLIKIINLIIKNHMIKYRNKKEKMFIHHKNIVILSFLYSKLLLRNHVHQIYHVKVTKVE